MVLRKLLIGLLVVVAAGSAAFAQNRNYIGASTGVPLALNVHYGFADMFGVNTDLRVIGRVQFIGAFGLAAVADAIHHFRTDSLSAPYAGGGVSAGFATASSGATSVAAVMWDIHGLGGYQHRIDDNWAVFGELNLGVGSVGVAVVDGRTGQAASAGGVGVTYAVRLGASYHF